MSRGIDLSGAVVVITGASSGIGRLAAQLFARNGSNVVLAAQVASWVHAALPRSYSDVVPVMTELVTLGRKAQPHHVGNVFEPMPELNSVHGGWRSPVKRASAGLGVLALAGGGIAVRRWRD